MKQSCCLYPDAELTLDEAEASMLGALARAANSLTIAYTCYKCSCGMAKTHSMVAKTPNSLTLIDPQMHSRPTTRAVKDIP